MDTIAEAQKLPYHTHNGVDAPKVKVVLSDVLTPQASPAVPSGGLTQDTQARTAIAAIISKLETIGIFI